MHFHRVEFPCRIVCALQKCRRTECLSLVVSCDVIHLLECIDVVVALLTPPPPLSRLLPSLSRTPLIVGGFPTVAGFELLRR